MAVDPLEQFVIKPIVPLHVGHFDISFTNSSLWMLIVITLATILFTAGMKKRAMVPGRLQVLVEMFYNMVADMVRSTIGPEGKKYLPFIFTLFITLLLGNMMGLIPYSFTFTSHIIVTATLSFSIFVCVILLGVLRHGTHFLHLFVPSGVPWFVYPLLVPIEIISYVARPITHGLRLFANMLAGHIMLQVFAGFSVMMIGAGALGVIGSLFPVIINAGLLGFELLIGLLQAYVFTILACIYLKDTIEIHH
ncbi:MAG TPA: F0F1 ATP synthase subunit A [Patescibacteria group bacterium]|nr:F0F1 ATP synthase subunit A [Patescibacteria group bacterium]